MNTRSRVLVWLDPNAPQEASLQVLEGLVTGASPEILGLFVEDINLLLVSGMSVAREVTFEGTAVRQLDPERIEQRFRAHAARMRSLFEKAVRALNARHSFRVTRGELRAELLKTAADFDTLVLSHSRHHFGTRLSIRAQLGELLVRGPRTLVLVQERWRTGQSVAVMFDGSPTAEAALRTAAALADSERVNLSIWLPAAEADTGAKLRAQAEELLGDARNLRFRTVAADDTQAIFRAADAEGVRALILPGADAEATTRMVPALLDRLSCSLIIVR